MRIFVTGHRGRMGGTVCPALDAAGHEIVGYDLAEGQSILRVDELAEVEPCEQVVHLAAIPMPRPGRTMQDYVLVNVVGTLNVLEAAREMGARRFLYASSGAVYGWDAEPPVVFPEPVREGIAFSLDTGMRYRVSSYGASKRMAEEVCRWYGTNTEMEVFVLRIGPMTEQRLAHFYNARAREAFLADVFPKLVRLPYDAGKRYRVFNVAEPGSGYSVDRLMEAVGDA